MPVKTDRKDARGIAQLMRLGWFRPVHCKSLPAQEVRALLTTRKLLQAKRYDVEMSPRPHEAAAVRRLRTEARPRRQDWAHEGLTPQRPLQKPAVLTSSAESRSLGAKR